MSRLLLPFVLFAEKRDREEQLAVRPPPNVPLAPGNRSDRAKGSDLRLDEHSTRRVHDAAATDPRPGEEASLTVGRPCHPNFN